MRRHQQAVPVCQGCVVGTVATPVDGLSDPVAWRSTRSPGTMRTMVSENGFGTASDDDLLTLARGLGLPSDADASLRNGRLAVAVRRHA